MAKTAGKAAALYLAALNLAIRLHFELCTEEQHGSTCMAECRYAEQVLKAVTEEDRTVMDHAEEMRGLLEEFADIHTGITTYSDMVEADVVKFQAKARALLSEVDHAD